MSPSNRIHSKRTGNFERRAFLFSKAWAKNLSKLGTIAREEKTPHGKIFVGIGSHRRLAHLSEERALKIDKRYHAIKNALIGVRYNLFPFELVRTQTLTLGKNSVLEHFDKPTVGDLITFFSAKKSRKNMPFFSDKFLGRQEDYFLCKRFANNSRNKLVSPELLKKTWNAFIKFCEETVPAQVPSPNSVVVLGSTTAGKIKFAIVASLEDEQKIVVARKEHAAQELSLAKRKARAEQR